MFGSLIKGLCSLKQIGLAVKVFAKMPLMGCTPNVIIIALLLKVFAAPVTQDLGLSCVVGWQEKGAVPSLTLLHTTLLSMAFAKRVILAWL